MLEYIDLASEKKADLLVFPELAIGIPGCSMDGTPSIDIQKSYDNAEYIPEGESTQLIIEQAKKHNMYIMWTMPEKTSRIPVMKNTSVLVGPEGFVGKYSKVHTVKGEKLLFEAGTSFPVFETKLGRIGMMICYDMHFPEAARSLVLNGAELIICGYATGCDEQKDDDHEVVRAQTIKRARALENMTPFVYGAYGGPFNPNDPSYGYGVGHAEIYDASGNILASSGWGPGLAVAELDIKKSIENARIWAMRGANLIEDRHPEYYGAVMKKTYDEE